MSSSTVPAVRSGHSTKQKVGFALTAVYGLLNVPSVLTAPPDGETGPPMAILVVDSLLGVLTLVAAILAWRGNRVALRIAAGGMILITLTALPAFFVDVPMFVKALTGLSVIWTVAASALMFSTDRRSTAVVD